MYERTLPSLEEFDAALHCLGLQNMGKDYASTSTTEQGSSSSVPLWAPNLLEDDENQFVSMVYIKSAGVFLSLLRFCIQHCIYNADLC